MKFTPSDNGIGFTCDVSFVEMMSFGITSMDMLHDDNVKHFMIQRIMEAASKSDWFDSAQFNMKMLCVDIVARPDIQSVRFHIKATDSQGQHDIASALEQILQELVDEAENASDEDYDYDDDLNDETKETADETSAAAPITLNICCECKNLNDVSVICNRISFVEDNESVLYKYDDKYHLVFHITKDKLDNIAYQLADFCEMRSVHAARLSFFAEHEQIICKNCIQTLAKLL